MILPVSRLGRLSLSKKVNPYKACIYGLCRDFLDGYGYEIWVQNFNFGVSLVAAVQNIFLGGHY